MKCATCGKDGLGLRDGQFIRAGKVLGSIPKHDFKCQACLNAIDNTTKVDVPPTNW